MNQRKLTTTLLALLVVGLLAACGGAERATPPPTGDVPPPTAALPTSTADALLPTTAVPSPTADAPSPTADSPSPTADTLFFPLDIGALAGVALVVTPPQGEGPFYPLEIPADADSDLTVVAGAAGAAQGDGLLLGGYVVDAAGNPLPGAVVEIWQTDVNGIYLHPGDAGFAQRDAGFQGFGAALTGADGSYFFRTILPGRYEPRPQHIHVRVLVDGRAVLTTQFYFVGDPQLARDGLAQAAGDALDALVITLDEGLDGENRPVLLAVQHIVVAP